MLAQALTDVLRIALNLDAREIRCTSALEYGLDFGADTNRQLQMEVVSAPVFVGLITRSSIESSWVLFELGARWGQQRVLLPVLAAGSDVTVLPAPIRHLLAAHCDDENQLIRLVEQIARELGKDAPSLASYRRQLTAVLQQDAALAQRGKIQPLAAPTAGEAVPPPSGARLFRVSVASLPRGVRAEGYTELVGDIQLELRGAIGTITQDVGVVVTARLSTNLTNRIRTDRVSDIVLTTATGDVLAQGRIHETAYNTVVFDRIIMHAKNGVLEQELLLRGMRANAVAVGVSNTYTTSTIQAAIHVTLYPGTEGYPVILHDQVTVAYVSRAMTSQLMTAKGSVSAGDGTILSAQRVRTFTTRFNAASDFTFTTHAEETYQGALADRGVVLALNFSSVPVGCELFVTVHELPPTDAPSGWSARSMLATTDANGAARGTHTSTPEYYWNKAIPMVPVGSGNLSCWKILQSMRSSRTELQFGIAIIGPVNEVLARAFQVAAGLAPFYTTARAGQPSSTLPVPRFTPGTVPQDASLDLMQ